MADKDPECTCISCQAQEAWGNDPHTEALVAVLMQKTIPAVGMAADKADKSAILLLAYLGLTFVSAAEDAAQLQSQLIDLSDEDRQKLMDDLRKDALGEDEDSL